MPSAPGHTTTDVGTISSCLRLMRSSGSNDIELAAQSSGIRRGSSGGAAVLAPVSRCCADRLTADVNGWPPGRIRFRLPQYLMRHRRRVAFTEENELHHVPKGVPLRPSEIDVRDLPRFVSSVRQ